MTTIDTPRIYVACLAAYNYGILHGAWINADQDADAIQADVTAMLAASPIPDAEEWAIHDYEGFSPLSLSEWEGFETVSALAELATEHDGLGLAIIHDGYAEDAEEARTMIEDRYLGCYDRLADYAEELCEETGSVPEHLAFYIDYAAMARDMEINGDIITVEIGAEIHIFTGR